MTDNEIIKSLKRIAQYSGFTDDVSNTLLSALDLINHQKAEIERLSIESETLVTQLKVAYEQICKLNMAKSEVIKEFEDK